MSIIRTKAQYEASLEELDALLRAEHPTGSAEARRVDELAALIEGYEKECFPFDLPSPVEAIEFRVQQLGLTRRDLEPLLGGRAKVSEVLSGKRPLTVRMIRALSQGLGIPADLLLQDPQVSKSSLEELEWSNFPVREMCRRGWIEAEATSSVSGVRDFVTQVLPTSYVPALFRLTESVAQGAIDRYALLAWVARALHLAQDKAVSKLYQKPADPALLLAQVARLSGDPEGPRKALLFLADCGIKLVVEPHLTKTRLDGAAMLDRNGQPVVALTIRYDRVDSFWFTLLHELVHILKHLDENKAVIADDLDLDRSASLSEAEADTLARNAFIPRQVWRRSDAYRLRSKKAIEDLAANLGIHPALVAGRLRYETGDYQRFGELLGKGEVRRLFSDVQWRTR